MPASLRARLPSNVHSGRAADSPLVGWVRARRQSPITTTSRRDTQPRHHRSPSLSKPATALTGREGLAGTYSLLARSVWCRLMCLFGPRPCHTVQRFTAPPQRMQPLAKLPPNAYPMLKSATQQNSSATAMGGYLPTGIGAAAETEKYNNDPYREAQLRL